MDITKINSVGLYKAHVYSRPEKEWKLEQIIQTNKSSYKNDAYKVLFDLAFRVFGDTIHKLEFPEPMNGELIYCLIENNEGEKFQLSLGV